MIKLFRRWARPFLGLSLFILALFVLDRQLHQYSLADILTHTRAIPVSALLLSAIFTMGSYLSMTAYDLIALRHLGHKLRYSRIALTSFIAHVFSLDLGLSIVGSSAIRYRLLSNFGIPTSDVARVITFTSIGFWVGALGIGGSVMTFFSLDISSVTALPITTTRPLGIVFISILLIYIVWSTARNKPIYFRGFKLWLLSLKSTLAQLIASAFDWGLGAAALYVFLPESTQLSFGHLLGVFIVAEALGVLSTVPAGLGVFEGICIVLLAPVYPAPIVLGSILAYRFIYTLLPIFVAVTLLGSFEISAHRAKLLRVQENTLAAFNTLVPKIFSLVTFLAGLLLMISSVLPPLALQIHFTKLKFLVDISHSGEMLAGISLTLIARGLASRTRACFHATMVLLLVGFVSAVFFSSHYILGAILLTLLISLWLCRAKFNNPSALSLPALPRYWALALILTLAGMLWLLRWVYDGGADTAELASIINVADYMARAQRSLFIASVVLVLFILWRISRPALPTTAHVNDADTQRAAAIVATSPKADASLALMGDKQFLFNNTAEALIMYGVSGNSLISMGDPVGPPDQHEALIWNYRELCDQHKAWPVFYEVGAKNLPTYLDLGLSLHKLGEYGKVSLAEFTLDGKAKASLRHSINRCKKSGCSFEIIPATETLPIMDTIEAISNSWLDGKNTSEKAFSLGAYQRDYVASMPIAVVHFKGRIVAFANMWCGANLYELSPDLMRYGNDAPKGVMEYLFVNMMLWGKQNGYQWFSLGMAPLSGMPEHQLASKWVRAGAFIYRHGEHFYNFNGLRAYKDKFEPVWESRYLASPGGLALPRVLTQVSTLVSGGLRAIIM
ncbi:MAG: bifunctional lysylphosphatidylglycerol flippase/synthetase MprF [Gammaproteobacteria bacterium]|nr:bifunctional lysylphosphatidylglycerol flippase/synthetase MprF [Gammaproteobacteria bacterium]MCP4090117.1 bifunctional lysylphosphatidylglycerol flippase/synthetase MprF [Gammaproteobacteria bacterium]MCP4276993.1 bifunctional lysylphosphatidylglycerol flippase/synthetase MprF [Gammaproteobacteria bacterium]MCP4831765.1 bifunctional lysylphosphatidylglycerol flippase/synthetase MprF [Gammaproteobacteria bacterium]MCP4929480.1 bifunctional lysylphosphatidylglycerol flippase/synthetase MprF 